MRLRSSCAGLLVVLAAASVVRSDATVPPLKLEVEGVEAGPLRLVRWNPSAGEDPIEEVLSPPERSGGGPLRVEVTRWADGVLWVEQEGMLSPGVPMERAALPEPVRLALRPAREVTGRLLGDLPPVLASVEAWRCGGELGPELWIGVYPARVEAGGRWSARVPAGCSHLRLRIPGATPVTFLAVEPPADAPGVLPPVAVSVAPALAVRTTAAETLRPLAGAVVHVLEPGEAPRAFHAALEGRSPAGGLRAATAEDGTLRFDRLATGTVRLLVRAPGRPPVLTPAFALQPAHEVVLPRLEIPRAASLTVLVADPPAAGGAASVRVTVWPQGGDRELAMLVQPLDATGSAEFTGLTPGSWRTGFLVEEQEGRTYGVNGPVIELLPGEHHLVSLSLATSTYRGRVTRNGEPVTATLTLVPMAAGAVDVPTTRTDEEGTFRVILAEPGSYQVRVTEGTRTVAVGEVRFERQDLPVEIELPAGRIAGRVVGPSGAPVPGAAVQAVRADDLHRGESPLVARGRGDSEGEFLLPDLEPGRWLLHARKGRLASRERAVEIDRSDPDGEVELELRESVELRLQVLGAGERPIAGATLEVVPLGPGEDVAPPPIARTDAEGRAAVLLGAGPVPEAIVAVLAEDHPVSVFRITVSAAPTTLRLSPGSDGRVRAVTVERRGLLVLFHAHGGFVPLDTLLAARRARWVEGEGVTTLELERLAPGSWTLQRIDSPDDYLRLVRGETTTGEVVATFHVEAGPAPLP